MVIPSKNPHPIVIMITIQVHDITNINIEPSKVGLGMIGNWNEDNGSSDGDYYNKDSIYDNRDDESYDKNGIYDNGEWLGYKDSNYDDNNHSNYEKEHNGSKSNNSDDNTNKVTSPHKVPVTNNKEGPLFE